MSVAWPVPTCMFNQDTISTFAFSLFSVQRQYPNQDKTSWSTGANNIRNDCMHARYLVPTIKQVPDIRCRSFVWSSQWSRHVNGGVTKVNVRWTGLLDARRRSSKRRAVCRGRRSKRSVRRRGATPQARVAENYRRQSRRRGRRVLASRNTLRKTGTTAQWDLNNKRSVPRQFNLGHKRQADGVISNFGGNYSLEKLILPHC
jgi:hypothetical protein